MAFITSFCSSCESRELSAAPAAWRYAARETKSHASIDDNLINVFFCKASPFRYDFNS